jgi:hypothetical protein
MSAITACPEREASTVHERELEVHLQVQVQHRGTPVGPPVDVVVTPAEFAKMTGASPRLVRDCVGTQRPLAYGDVVTDAEGNIVGTFYPREVCEPVERPGQPIGSAGVLVMAAAESWRSPTALSAAPCPRSSPAT